MEFRGIKPIEDVAPLAALATQIDMHVERCGTQYVVTGMAGGDQRVLLTMLGGIMTALVASTPDEHKGDLVNYVKSFLDALHGIYWIDDNQICEIHAKKYYGAKPRIEIEVSEINE